MKGEMFSTDELPVSIALPPKVRNRYYDLVFQVCFFYRVSIAALSVTELSSAIESAKPQEPMGRLSCTAACDSIPLLYGSLKTRK